MSVRRFIIPRTFQFTRTQPGSVEVVVAADHDLLIREARAIIEELLAVQNGCPLPKYQEDFDQVNALAREFLERTEEAQR